MTCPHFLALARDVELVCGYTLTQQHDNYEALLRNLDEFLECEPGENRCRRMSCYVAKLGQVGKNINNPEIAFVELLLLNVFLPQIGDYFNSNQRWVVATYETPSIAIHIQQCSSVRSYVSCPHTAGECVSGICTYLFYNNSIIYRGHDLVNKYMASIRWDAPKRFENHTCLNDLVNISKSWLIKHYNEKCVLKPMSGFLTCTCGNH